MSTRNREKRSAKQKQRRRAAADRQVFGGRPSYVDDRALRHQLIVATMFDAARHPEDGGDVHVSQLLDLAESGRELDVAADAAVESSIRLAWEAGWMPVDLHEHTRRRLDADAAGYVVEAIGVEARRYPSVMIHPRWHDSLAVVAGGADVGTATPHSADWAARRGLSRRDALSVVLEVLALLVALPPLERLVPLPGESRHSVATGASGAVDEKVLAKVRGLLAKAESTEFPDEAEALSAKAQELMSRYSLHQAVLDHDRGRKPAASARRMWMDAPYAGAKAHLGQAVAQANRCRAVWMASLEVLTVVGDGTDLDTVELLTTSLLVQANRAMLGAGRHITRNGQSRTRSFRQSFLIAYAARIGERLDEASTAATAEVEHDDRLLPVLAARSRVADDMTERLFPRMVRRSVSVTNAEGWGAGRAAADLARFDVRGAVAG